MALPPPYIGKWRITHMEQWDQEFVDLVTTGHVTIRKDGTGEFQFGAVQGEMDCRIDDPDHPGGGSSGGGSSGGGGGVLGFTWAGFDEYEPVSGRGWVKVEGKRMEGHLFFHQGDDSAFEAKKTK